MIIVDANESACGLAKLLAGQWDHVQVQRLRVGDIAIGDRVLIERKTVEDYLASLADGRLFRQATQLTAAPRPILIREGDPAVLRGHIDPGALRGVELALAVGFRIPILTTSSLVETASCVRHIAAQEARREARRRRNAVTSTPVARGSKSRSHRRLPPEAFNALLALPGVGLERARAIANHVGSMSDLCRLGIRDLLSVPGVGPDTAARIVDALRGSVESNSRREE